MFKRIFSYCRWLSSPSSKQNYWPELWRWNLSNCKRSTIFTKLQQGYNFWGSVTCSVHIISKSLLISYRKFNVNKLICSNLVNDHRFDNLTVVISLEGVLFLFEKASKFVRNEWVWIPEAKKNRVSTGATQSKAFRRSKGYYRSASWSDRLFASGIWDLIDATHCSQGNRYKWSRRDNDWFSLPLLFLSLLSLFLCRVKTKRETAGQVGNGHTESKSSVGFLEGLRSCLLEIDL